MTKKIMVVDDEPDILFTVGQMLEMCGYEVIKAGNGEECLSKLGEVIPDLVLLDIMMPEISGWDVAAKNTMSIGMGNMASEDYITKPFDIDDLKTRVERILNK